ncbi:cytochrome c oxidase assembly protein COX11, mitochondrial-like isoform X1 [Panicum virgatum]|uniref:Uncharacterized protein n=1 Tax=Panicum virgatum TaxID=38727 RepID=A0A8T0MK61_PANVG|nr:cytochrome c oxidase assembly protein COX11, mitochondrial-like isoform X1 [Panicum virgatum]KAG2535679.1 hypothetical protein PVAP13_9NG129000 [Panicum virgatum]
MAMRQLARLHQRLPPSLPRRHATRHAWPPAADAAFLCRGLASSSSSSAAAASAAGREKSSRRTLGYLLGVAVAMVGASYAAVPLYRRFCQATGYGGTVQRRESVEEKISRHARDGTTTSRVLKVSPRRPGGPSLPWATTTPCRLGIQAYPARLGAFKTLALRRSLSNLTLMLLMECHGSSFLHRERVKPGESALAFYTAENRSSAPITGVSTYNVAPMKAAIYFNKIQCFCFEEQTLLPGEQIDMPVFFYIDPEFETDPKMEGVNNIVLSYTFFKVNDR